MNEVLKDPISELIDKYKKEGKIIEINPEVRNAEIKRINEELQRMPNSPRIYLR